jgi:hypothetical protein
MEAGDQNVANDPWNISDDDDIYLRDNREKVCHEMFRVLVGNNSPTKALAQILFAIESHDANKINVPQECEDKTDETREREYVILPGVVPAREFTPISLFDAEAIKKMSDMNKAKILPFSQGERSNGRPYGF